MATLVAINEAWSIVLGWSEVEVKGVSVLDFVHADDRDTTRDALRRAVASGATAEFRNRLRHQDGTYRRISWIAAADGECIRAAGHDVSPEPEAIDGLRESRDRLRQALKVDVMAQLSRGIAHDFAQVDWLHVLLRRGALKTRERDCRI